MSADECRFYFLIYVRPHFFGNKSPRHGERAKAFADSRANNDELIRQLYWIEFFVGND